MSGTVEGIAIAAEPGGRMQVLESVHAVAERGLEGDRYGVSRGTFSKGDGTPPDRGTECTLIESEAIEAVKREYEIEYAHLDSRRNILTRGIALNHLVGREFTVGGVRMRGNRLAEPCGHMEKLCGKKGARAALIHRGGLRAEVLSDGKIRVGDAITS